MAEDWQAGGFGLYLHWPFCEAKCPYCDFNSHVAREIDQVRWKRAYLREIDRYAALLPGRVLSTVYFGGGTPSLMQPDTVADILDRVRTSWPTANELEVTLEANPSSVEAGRLAAYAEAGVSRVSMGLQALNDEDLRRLGRLHTVAEAQQALDIARKTFPRVSFDLIYARQGQTPEDCRRELRQALAMAGDHLSLYQLTIEPGTAFGDRFARGKLLGLPKDDLAAEMYEITQELCDASGFSAYEVSNHAKKGAESRHNLIYWRYGDYVGIGPGAHGRVTLNGERNATTTCLSPSAWLQAAEAGNADEDVVQLSRQDQANEFLMMGLRLTEGLDLERYHALVGAGPPSATLQHLQDIGMISVENTRLRATTRGRMVLNSVIEKLLVG